MCLSPAACREPDHQEAAAEGAAVPSAQARGPGLSIAASVKHRPAEVALCLQLFQLTLLERRAAEAQVSDEWGQA